ncbi:type II toxin-antitoxin system VapC family toxin [candidate division TA06 bacterium]|uniref:Ribonuclease VapC n=1 Tax=candidate division TA06 bacterium TaxID=2250710 RepID=A0A933I738_UNCT6|nr:type II toxin-antitoxin system VapC family toxin [candidate division TA06 bacterium]
MVLDACALIAFLKEEDGAETVEHLLRQAEAGKIDILMHSINLLEIYYGVYRADGPVRAETLMEAISRLPVTVIDALAGRLLKEAGRIKASHVVSLADSVAVALAIARNAELVTSDRHEFGIVEKKEAVRFYWIR